LRKKLSEARAMNKEIGKHLADSGCFGRGRGNVLGHDRRKNRDIDLPRPILPRSDPVVVAYQVILLPYGK
jgi:hypothetical protein